MNRKYCPKCSHQVPKSQIYLRNYVWAKWNCSNCGALLGFNKKRRNLMILPNVIVLLLIFYFTEPYGLAFYLWLGGWLLLFALILVPMVDRIKVLDNTD
jgi:hypothetical protein